MQSYITQLIRPLTLFAFAFLAWTGFPPGVIAAPGADTDGPSLDPLAFGGPSVKWAHESCKVPDDPNVFVGVPTAEREAAQTVTVSMETCFNTCGIRASALYYELRSIEEALGGLPSTAYDRAASWWSDCVASCDEIRQGDPGSSGT